MPSTRHACITSGSPIASRSNAAISPDTVALLKARGYDVDYSPGVVLAQTAAIVSDERMAAGRIGRAVGSRQGRGVLSARADRRHPPFRHTVPNPNPRSRSAGINRVTASTVSR